MVEEQLKLLRILADKLRIELNNKMLIKNRKDKLKKINESKNEK